ncbi:hypothetical protein MKW94_019551, partial [Papaver nudicaule]|nr:hypothetical protein [Papaver nudicaule]
MRAWAWAWLWEAKNQKEELIQAFVTFSIILIAISWYLWVRKRPADWNSRLPPGPLGLPIVGNIPFIDPELHRYFAILSIKYGPIVKLKLGSKLVIVLGSPELAEVVLKEFDSTFDNRDPTVAAMSFSYGGADMVFAKYGPHWRNVRALCVREIMSKNTLDSFSTLRKQEIRKTLRRFYAKVNSAVSIRQEMHLTMLNVIMSMLWGGTFDDEDRNKIGLEFGRLAEEMIIYLGRTNISDFFPVVAKFDLQGIERRMKELSSWLDTFFESVIAKRVRMDHELKPNGDQDGKENKVKDFLQVILQLQDQQQGEAKTPFTTTNLKALFL